jgi:hypothetical protein
MANPNLLGLHRWAKLTSRQLSHSDRLVDNGTFRKMNGTLTVELSEAESGDGATWGETWAVVANRKGIQELANRYHQTEANRAPFLTGDTSAKA